ncbi:4-(cytidine 5'-diphospho)-2-C-methyl-D-erythritol kinase [Synechococcus sp. RC10A2]|uniref:4-(cytidine 5'-diphospho)-2-C-methyl-D-erythritol kinase n=1 Tax=Synechococcus sp. RC10A2 TaxID=2964529 RepID=UPI0039C608F4
MMRLEGHAPAKLNLTLEVLGRRADGYHEVASIMHTLSLCDTLTLELPPPDRLNPARGAIHIVEASDGAPLRETIPTDSRNLVWQAVGRFGEMLNLPPSMRFPPLREGNQPPSVPPACRGNLTEGVQHSWHATLLKRIPSQAGLGGGSSDAACALCLLNQWAAQYERALPDDALYALACELGTDVAFFLNGGCALATGKGERLQPLPTLPPFWWVLAKPYEVGVPTGWAYAQLGRGAVSPNARADHTERLARLLPTIRTPRDLAPLLHNDFDTPILQAIPALAELRTLLEQGGALRVILCGSGAAQAALCESEDHAKTLANALIRQNYWAVRARSC